MVDSPARVFGTFGFCRFVLACMVVVSHTIPERSFVGVYAVFAFFMISGHIVSYILHYTYLPLRHGVWKYTINRALRIYPAYWIALSLSLYCITLNPQKAREIFPAIGYPHGMGEWVANIFTFTMSHPLSGKLIEPSILPISWSLGVEMLFWALMPILLMKKDLRGKVLIGAALYALLVLVLSLSHPSSETLAPRYYSPFAAALPFCIGLQLFLNKLHGRCKFTIPFGIAAIIAFCVFIYAAPYLFTEMYFSAFYVAVFIEALVIAFLSQIDQRTLSNTSQRIDAFFGNLAYPLFLLHLPVAMSLHIMLPAMKLYTYQYCLVVITLSSVAALLMYGLVEVPVNRLKRSLKC